MADDLLRPLGANVPSAKVLKAREAAVTTTTQTTSLQETRLAEGPGAVIRDGGDDEGRRIPRPLLRGRRRRRSQPGRAGGVADRGHPQHPADRDGDSSRQDRRSRAAPRNAVPGRRVAVMPALTPPARDGVHAEHRIRDPPQSVGKARRAPDPLGAPGLAVDVAFDTRCEPTLGVEMVDDALREVVLRIREYDPLLSGF